MVPRYWLGLKVAANRKMPAAMTIVRKPAAAKTFRMVSSLRSRGCKAGRTLPSLMRPGCGGFVSRFLLGELRYDPAQILLESRYVKAERTILLLAVPPAGRRMAFIRLPHPA